MNNLAWQKEQYTDQFGRAIRWGNDLYFLIRFQRYLPARCLNYVINRNCETIIDIGCSAGDFYNYLRYHKRFKQLKYCGFDVSQPAIASAKRNYPERLFTLISDDKGFIGLRADIVLSIDVLSHQHNPFEHLRALINCAERFIVLATRTRDEGETILDCNKSCQLHAGNWVPWIVFNTKELYDKILCYSHTHVKIISFKEYKQLQGGNRHLPKELYLPNAKTAITTMIIEKIKEPTSICEYKCGEIERSGYNKFLWIIGALFRRCKLETFARYTYENVLSIEDILRYSKGSIMCESK